MNQAKDSSLLYTLGRLILAYVKFCNFEIFRFSLYFNLANSWKINELDKMVSDIDSTEQM